MSIKVMTHVWSTSQYGGSDLLLLLALADTAHDDGYGWLSVPALAKKSRMSERSVQRALRAMESHPHQELQLLRNKGPHGCHAFQFLTLPEGATECRGDRMTPVTKRRGDRMTPKPEATDSTPVIEEAPAQVSTGDNLSGCQSVGVTSEAAGVTDLSPSPSLDPFLKILPPSPPTVEPSPKPLTPGWLMQLYNTGTPADHPKVMVMTAGRMKKATRYLKMFPQALFWEQVIAEVAASNFLRGQNPSPEHPNFRGNLDWLLSMGKDGTENCIKVYEGQYQDGRTIPPLTRPARVSLLDARLSFKEQRTAATSLRILEDAQDERPRHARLLRRT